MNYSGDVYFLLEEVSCHLAISSELIIYKILYKIVALDLVLNENFFTVKKPFSRKNVELKTLFMKCILLKIL